MIKVQAFTDGSAYWKTGCGGFGCYIKYEKGDVQTINQGFTQTKIGRMELLAVIRVLEAMTDEDIDLTIYSDSEYVVKSINEGRLEKWLEKDFVGTANSDLWERFIDALCDKPNTKFEIKHIRGHQKVVDELTEGNNKADELADYRQFDTRTKDIPDEIWEKVKSNKNE